MLVADPFNAFHLSAELFVGPVRDFCLFIELCAEPAYSVGEVTYGRQKPAENGGDVYRRASIVGLI